VASINNKQLQEWELFLASVRKYTPVNITENAADKKKRIAALEAKPQEWKRYYFPQYFKYESPAFHVKSSKRILNKFKELKHWIEVRHWARGLAKSTTCMFDVLYLVLTGQLKNIILTSSTYDAAKAFLNKYQAQLEANQRIINDYGIQMLPGSWTNGDFTTRKGAKFLALGARQSPRGNGNDEIRPDCIIVDDFDTDEECRNTDIINQKWDWYEKALFFTVDVAEPYLIIWNGNIIAEDCCVVRAGSSADYTEIINIRDADGKSVWPQKNSEADIDYQLSKVSYEAGQQELFNNPIRLGQVFKEMVYGFCPPLKKLPFAVIYADPSPSNKDRPAAKAKLQNSCKAVVVIGYHENTYYVYKAWVDSTTNANFVTWLYAAHKLVEAATQPYCYIENNTLQDPFYQQVLLPLIYEIGRAMGGILPVTPDDRKKPEKYFRIEGNLEPINRMGRLILNIAEKDDPHMKRLEAQFKSVSVNSKTMDGPDAVEGGVHKIKDKVNMEAAGGIETLKRPTNNKRF
jgi:hypothetical protein